MPKNCPVCHSPLAPNGAAHSCKTCGGIFFEEGAFDTRADAAANSGTPLTFNPNLHARRSCPACGLIMVPYRYQYTSPVTLDGCDECGGIWVDGGELAQIRSFLASEASPEAAARLEIGRAVSGLEQEASKTRARAAGVQRLCEEHLMKPATWLGFLG